MNLNNLLDFSAKANGTLTIHSWGVAITYSYLGDPAILAARKTGKDRYKKVAHTVVRSETEQAELIELIGRNERRAVEVKEQKAAERAKLLETIAVGDIFYGSWGYEQTNVDFYQVVERKGRETFVLQELRQQRKSAEGYGPWAGYCRPLPGEFRDDERITKRLTSEGGFRMESFLHLKKLESPTTWHYYSSSY